MHAHYRYPTPILSQLANRQLGVIGVLVKQVACPDGTPSNTWEQDQRNRGPGSY